MNVFLDVDHPTGDKNVFDSDFRENSVYPRF